MIDALGHIDVEGVLDDDLGLAGGDSHLAPATVGEGALPACRFRHDGPFQRKRPGRENAHAHGPFELAPRLVERHEQSGLAGAETRARGARSPFREGPRRRAGLGVASAPGLDFGGRRRLDADLARHGHQGKHGHLGRKPRRGPPAHFDDVARFEVGPGGRFRSARRAPPPESGRFGLAGVLCRPPRPRTAKASASAMPIRQSAGTAGPLTVARYPPARLQTRVLPASARRITRRATRMLSRCKKRGQPDGMPLAPSPVGPSI